MLTVFISHSNVDDEVAHQLRAALEGHGIQAWEDSRELAPGNQLQPAVQKAIDDSSHVVVVLSPQTANSAWVRKEIRYAESQGKPLIPILLDGLQYTALDLWFERPPLPIPMSREPGGMRQALLDLMRALGLALPADRDPGQTISEKPVADLVLELIFPAILHAEGKRRATAKAQLIYSPPDGSRKVEGGRFLFTAPLGPIEEGEISWYLERYVDWPSPMFLEQAKRVEEQLPEWGQLLYRAVDVNSGNTVEAWKNAGAGIDRRFSVLVNPSLEKDSGAEQRADANEAATLLLSLPWELIHDGTAYLFQGARGVRVRRRLPNRELHPKLATNPPIRVLLVSPRPEDESAPYIDHRVSARPVVEALWELGELAEFKLLNPPTFPALQQELKRAYDSDQPYDVVHFDGHGVYDRQHGLGALCFEDPADSAKPQKRRSQLVMADTLAAALRDHRTALFFLDACQTAMTAKDPTASVAAKLLESGVASVAAMSHSVLVETARRFVSVFYRKLMEGARVGDAMLAGQLELKRDTWRAKAFTGDLHLEDWFVPVLFQEEKDPQVIQRIPGRDVRELVSGDFERSMGATPKAPPHAFVGRSRELLAAERLLEHRPYVAIRGEGGEGKTTLAAELARWLVRTRRFERAVFVSLERSGDARLVQLAIGEQLVPNFVSQAALDDKIGPQLIERALKERATVIVLDNLESVLPPAQGSPAAAAFEPEVLTKILDLCQKINGIRGTRLIFTTREALPPPFEHNEVRIGRLARQDAIALVGRVLGEGKLMPHVQDEQESDDEIDKLVEAVHGHARSLVLLAGEVARAGVRDATKNLHALMAALHQRYPDNRERSLFASVELSLRRLSPETQEKIKPLGVFQGGGSLFAIGTVLKLDIPKDEEVDLARQLVDVGLAEMLPYTYVRFDPALAPALLDRMSEAERATAQEGWAEAMAKEANVLNALEQQDPEFAYNLAQLDIANLVGCLEYLSHKAPPEQVVTTATDLESLLEHLGRPKVLAQIVKIRNAAALRLGTWSHSAFMAESAAIDRFRDSGRFDLAVDVARRLLERATAAGEEAYKGARYDIAKANWLLGRCLQMAGLSNEALPWLEESKRRFEALGQESAAGKVLGEKADCLVELGRFDEGVLAYEEALGIAERLNDPRSAAVNIGQIATARMHQGKYDDALQGFEKAKKIFEGIGDLRAVATAWHQMGIIHRLARQYRQAEHAFQQSLKIETQIGHTAGEASTLNELGTLYSVQARREDAARFYRQAAAIYGRLKDTRKEGAARNNLSDELRLLERYDEAREEIAKAIACKEQFGHTAEPWKSFYVLQLIEQAAGNRDAALKARQSAVQAFLSYRRDGGENPYDRKGFYAAITNAIRSGQIDELRQALSQAPGDPRIAALQAILAGSRDPALADHPDLKYRDTAEILLLIEKLPAAN